MVLLLVAAFLLVGCAGAIVIKDDPSGATISIGICGGATFRLVVQQPPDVAKGETQTKAETVDGTVKNGEARFESGSLERFDYSRPVNLQLFLVSTGNGDCPFKPGDVYVANDVTLSPVPGDSDAHSVPLSKFSKR